MPVSPAYRPDPRFAALGPDFADPVRPAAFPRADIRFRNQRAAATVGLEALDDDEWRAAFARFEPLPDNQPEPLAMRYHGHQFRGLQPRRSATAAASCSPSCARPGPAACWTWPPRARARRPGRAPATAG